ncbi:MAG: undecaprenyl-phosphate galactose phosphotransferase WbaP [Planctomycetes bacterium]|nr:undecaprenyl-phosphate galactose phosphotransferase WbaP [Planctomycetota bacterium]
MAQGRALRNDTVTAATEWLTDRAVDAARLGAVRPRGWLTGLVFAVADLCVMSVAFGAAVVAWYLVEHQYELSEYWELWPCVLVFPVAFAGAKLYPGVITSPPEEFRRQSLVVTLVFLVFGTATFLAKAGPSYSRAVFLITWVLSVVLLPAGRAMVRRFFAHRSWYGYPVAVIGSGESATAVVNTLRSQPEIGLKPVVLLHEGEQPPDDIEGVPIASSDRLAMMLGRDKRIHCAVVAMSGVHPARLTTLIESHLRHFRRIILVPDLPALSTLWVTGRDIGGMLGLEVDQRLLDPTRLVLKWIVEAATLTVLVPFMLLASAMIAVLIRIDSRGPLLIGLQRVGRGGRVFREWKFRTMVADADEVLRRALEADPTRRTEWEQTRKLRDDPRLTRVGRFLRRTSLDELPQVFNVLIGQMSLVGPRPITVEEADRYGTRFPLYMKVKPGITGLWQISGRSNLTYPERVKLDAYYVLNWSVWLDAYILIRTVWIVLAGRGAY